MASYDTSDCENEHENDSESDNLIDYSFEEHENNYDAEKCLNFREGSSLSSQKWGRQN